MKYKLEDFVHIGRVDYLNRSILQHFAANRKLSEDEEAVCQYLERLDTVGTSTRLLGGSLSQSLVR